MFHASITVAAEMHISPGNPTVVSAQHMHLRRYMWVELVRLYRESIQCLPKGKQGRKEVTAHCDSDYNCVVCEPAPLEPDDGGGHAVPTEALSIWEKIRG
ncbi:hypothetical protein DOTSEDRAFT_43104 [Dothistroma septosporum NZE10]|uniref:Uncharacterized protein n=1 Tax=Dothistroma septosporum (strain NZE10 / CBS 128990) TaxID=675120 RepID=N1PWQ1_DOTSN|nr:hypothetical protein DOTSEDRAFT_43104 [Dothistroma septosporum NZE10]